jgi:APA family basic amino acid/polyamine antiporter
MVSFTIAGLGCALAALCYAEFAAMAPVAGSAYTYAYTTLGEIFAWIIGWDLILEYAMGCATVASSWTKHLNELLENLGLWRVPDFLSFNPYEPDLPIQPWLNLPSVFIMLFVTTVLVIGIRESVRTNAILVIMKLGVVLVVIFVGCAYVNSANWTTIPVSKRVLPQERIIPKLAEKHLGEPADSPSVKKLSSQLTATYRREWAEQEAARLQKAGRLTPAEMTAMIADTRSDTEADMPQTEADRDAVESLLPKVRAKGEEKAAASWGLLGTLGLNRWLIPIDDSFRSPFAPYGLSGLMLGASIVFFAFIGFDSISTHAEEAKKPSRDVPIGILTSLFLCTALYIAVAAIVTGMIPYPKIDTNAPIAVAFSQKAASEQSTVLNISTVLVSAGGLAGMTSVLLVLFLSQARIFMAMSRDGLLPKVFSTVHPRFRTPHVATITTGVVICIVAALTPIRMLAEMVNVGTLMAFVIVCASVLILRRQRPNAKRPFRCPVLWLVAPLGIVVNLTLMLFLPIETWMRLVIWLLVGFIVYFGYSRRHSHLVKHLLHEIQAPRDESIDNANGAVSDGGS